MNSNPMMRMQEMQKSNSVNPGGPKKQKMKKNELPKIISEGKGLYGVVSKVANTFYQLFFITRKFCKTFLWGSSFFILMFVFPMGLEYMSEQNRIYAKLMMSMNDMQPGAGGGQP